MSNFPFVTNTKQVPIDRKTLTEIASTLELEYAGGSVQLDKANIGNFSNTITNTRLQSFALHHNIIAPLIDAENTIYITPPNRVGTLSSTKPVTKKVQTHIQSIYDDLDFDLFIDNSAKLTALTGTVLMRPIYDEELEKWIVITLTPGNPSVKVIGHPLYPGIMVGLKYDIELEDGVMTLHWTKDILTTTIKTSAGIQTITEPHSYGRIPFSILKYSVSTKSIWGSPDVELYTLAKHRSLILANTMARTHLSDMEKLIISGMTVDKAIEAVQSKLIVLPTQKSPTGQDVQPTAQFISPQAEDALSLFKIYLELLSAIKDTRGHVQKIFSRGADVPSAESIRLGSVELYNKQQSKKKYLTAFEQDIWDIIQRENRLHPSLPQLPDNIELRVDFLPDPYSFANANEEISYFEAAIRNNVETPITWIMNRQSEFNSEEALSKYEENKKFNEEDKKAPSPVNNINTPGTLVDPTLVDPTLDDVPNNTSDEV